MFNEKETATAFLQEISNYLYRRKRRLKYSFAFCVNCDLISEHHTRHCGQTFITPNSKFGGRVRETEFRTEAVSNF